MKKIKLLSLLAIAGTTLFVSCSKKEKEELTFDYKPELAFIKGAVKANLNTTNDTMATTFLNFENAPAGTVIYARFNSADLITNPSGTYADAIVKATVDSKGEYMLTVPARYKVVTLTIYADDFTADQVTSTSPAQSYRKVYNLTPVTVGVSKDQTVIQDLFFN